ncbi:hypothetical protein BKA63DRAFT_602284 [Paraphoma chrysanthemicola]|nr:hypothetical protein BKA63DRAFT_602284 [Paraphoma chrysanthemicola]
MAPRTPRTSATTQGSAAPVKQDDDEPVKRPAPKTPSENRAAKRPARGFHTFRNGMLNVMPKGDELDLVKANQDSPLLQLPPEIRNRIWRFVLGGMTFRQKFIGRSSKRVLSNKPRDAKNAMAMLRVCRQFYAECAALPYSLNSFSFEYNYTCMEAFGTALRRLRAHQRSQINEVQFDFPEYSVWIVDRFAARWPFEPNLELGFLKLLPNLRCIQLCFFREAQPTGAPFEKSIDALRSAVEADMCSRGYKLNITKIEKTITEHENEWRLQPAPNAEE